MPRAGGLPLCLLAVPALVPAALGAHLADAPATEAATPGTRAQQMMRSEDLGAQTPTSLADRGAQQGSTAVQGLADTVPGAAGPPLDAGIKLSYPSFPFFGSTVAAGDSAAAPAAVPVHYAPAPVQHSYAPAPVQHSYAPAPVQYAPASLPAPAPQWGGAR
mmetsp:Transcript_109878/g.311621  ORF Transcript_109878/g.311621 Transcript_109878/m.311621 type:complete len:161 (-) Transcript_109878:127-609(-)